MAELSKTYSPSEFEGRIYKRWGDLKAFEANSANVLSGEKKPFTIVIPPPNITGQLHLGHALDNTIQDIIIRYKRMSGFETLWVPGTDHASIATESKIVAAMTEEGLTKEQIGREKFLERAWEWKEKYGGRIIEQLKKLGSSCDWSRERFTFDEGCSNAVRKVFVKLYDEGKIYRGVRVINWCPKCKTSISDVEVEYEEQSGNFWHIAYPLKDGPNTKLVVATTRPETMLGDTAVAVNPADERYKDLIGKTIILPLTNREIPIIADDYVDKNFGTGAVKITPAHDPNDYEVGIRHNLPIIHIMDDGAIITAEGKYKGLERYKARKQIIGDLKTVGLLVKIEPHKHNVGTCQRCHTTVEPVASRQWFVKMKELAKPAIKSVEDGDIKFIPDRFKNMFYAWFGKTGSTDENSEGETEKIRDWCISRQLWWGHRIPVFYCKGCNSEFASETHLNTCPKCGGEVVQDEDTLDTWFSSALWPFSTLGFWNKPNDETLTDDYKAFYPTQTLVTGYDIITFWVSRMIFSGLEYTGEKPFSDIVIHGLIRDKDGKKMSKHAGNGVDPLEVIDEYGADALRIAVILGSSLGSDSRWTDDKILYARNFVNKFWNASRYILMNLTGDETGFLPSSDKLENEDKWILTSLQGLTANITENLEKYDVGIALGNLINFFWDMFCDNYIELSKTRISTDVNCRNVIVYVLTEFLKLFHPFIPFITEEIYSALPNADGLLMLRPYPSVDKEFIKLLDADNENVQNFSQVIESITAVRRLRKEKDVADKVKINIEIETPHIELFRNSTKFFIKICNAESVIVEEKIEETGKTLTVCLDQRIFIPSSDLFDRAKEEERLKKELIKINKDVEFSEKKLSNQGFLAKAPESQVTAEKEKLAKNTELRDSILKSIEALGNI